jgi:hypothetical protein
MAGKLNVEVIDDPFPILPPVGFHFLSYEITVNMYNISVF